MSDYTKEDLMQLGFKESNEFPGYLVWEKYYRLNGFEDSHTVLLTKENNKWVFARHSQSRELFSAIKNIDEAVEFVKQKNVESGPKFTPH